MASFDLGSWPRISPANMKLLTWGCILAELMELNTLPSNDLEDLAVLLRAGPVADNPQTTTTARLNILPRTVWLRIARPVRLTFVNGSRAELAIWSQPLYHLVMEAKGAQNPSVQSPPSEPQQVPVRDAATQDILAHERRADASDLMRDVSSDLFLFTHIAIHLIFVAACAIAFVTVNDFLRNYNPSGLDAIVLDVSEGITGVLLIATFAMLVARDLRKLWRRYFSPEPSQE